MGQSHQDRYVAHQSRKAAMLAELIEERHSERRFADTPLDPATIDRLLADSRTCPSSCDRRAVTVDVVTDRDRKALLGGLLVGGVGWIHRAPAVLLLFAARDAYLAPGEIAYMPYIDGGTVVQQLYLSATALGLAGCYCNPNIREWNRDHFADMFGDDLFVGAFAVGHPRERTQG